MESTCIRIRVSKEKVPAQGLRVSLVILSRPCEQNRSSFLESLIFDSHHVLRPIFLHNLARRPGLRKRSTLLTYMYQSKTPWTSHLVFSIAPLSQQLPRAKSLVGTAWWGYAIRGEGRGWKTSKGVSRGEQAHQELCKLANAGGRCWKDTWERKKSPRLTGLLILPGEDWSPPGKETKKPYRRKRHSSATAPLPTLHQLFGTDSQKTSVSSHILPTELLISS